MSETPDEIQARVRKVYEEKRKLREEAERAEGELPARSFSPDPPSSHGAVEVDGVELMVPVAYTSLNSDLRTLTNSFIVKMAAANGDKEWQAQLSTEYLWSARRICLEMIG